MDPPYQVLGRAMELIGQAAQVQLKMVVMRLMLDLIVHLIHGLVVLRVILIVAETIQHIHM